MAGNRAVRWAASALLMILMWTRPAPLGAQSTRESSEPAPGRLGGHVRDASGLVAPRITVILRNTLTGASRQQNTNDIGEYSFTGVPEGRYFLSATADGFANEARSVRMDARAASQVIDLQLRIAPVSQEVTVVSGSRIEELREESPAQVEAVTREQIRDTGYERVSDTLSEIPGVVIRSGSTATVGAEQIQGVDSRQVLVLQDGLPVVGARGIKSGIVNLNRQGVGKLERVEVAKGAAGALYGSDAIGGVINMITREPRDPFELGIDLSSGSLGSVDGRIELGGRWRKLAFLTDLESHRQDSYGLIPGNPSTVGPDFQRNDVLAKLGYAFSERAALRFTASAYHNHQTGIASASTGLTLGTSNDSVQSYALTGDFTLTPSTILQTRAYVARYDENSKSDVVGSNAPSFGFANLNERYHRLDATLSRQLGAWQFLQGGVEWAQDEYRGANRLAGDNAGQQVTTNDVWMQDRLQPLRRLTITLGGRLQHHSLYGDHLVPKVGAVYRLSDRWIARASYGKGFRAPDLGQLYYRFANPASFYQVIGNPNLRPESSASFSAGLMYQQPRFRFGVNLFRHNLNDLIDTYTAGTPATADQLTAMLAQYGIPTDFAPLLNRLTFIYLNLNRARTEGFELNGSLAITRRIRTEGAYTYLDGIDRATGLLLPQRHRHQGYWKLSFDDPRHGFIANVRGTMFSKWPLNPAAGTYAFGYRIWDAYASKRIAAGFQAFAAIDNLADSRDQKLSASTPAFDRPDYGRTFRVGLRFTLTRER